MTTKKQGAPQISGAPLAEKAERVSDVAARFAAAEDAAREDRDRIGKREMAAAFFATVPPSAVRMLLKTFSVQQITRFLAQIPEISDPEFARWSERHFQSLEAFNITGDVQRLEGLGIRREAMAVAMMAIKFSPVFDRGFKELGNKRKRRQRVKALLAPVPVLDDLASILGELPPLLSADFVSPSKISSDLKYLSSILNWGEWICDSLGANSLFEVSKFALASLVRETTEKFLDREVSNLTGAALDDGDYDETRHRVWRSSNYERLRQNVPFVTRALVALNTVVSLPKDSQ